MESIPFISIERNNTVCVQLYPTNLKFTSEPTHFIGHYRKQYTCKKEERKWNNIDCYGFFPGPDYRGTVTCRNPTREMLVELRNQKSYEAAETTKKMLMEQQKDIEEIKRRPTNIQVAVMNKSNSHRSEQDDTSSLYEEPQMQQQTQQLDTSRSQQLDTSRSQQLDTSRSRQNQRPDTSRSQRLDTSRSQRSSRTIVPPIKLPIQKNKDDEFDDDSEDTISPVDLTSLRLNDFNEQKQLIGTSKNVQKKYDKHQIDTQTRHCLNRSNANDGRDPFSKNVEVVGANLCRADRHGIFAVFCRSGNMHMKHKNADETFEVNITAD
jgi:hypothetical protein